MLNQGDGTRELVWNGLHPKVRNLLLAAYQDVNMPKEDQTKGFLKSRRTKVI